MEEEDTCHNITANSGMQMYQDKQNLVRIKDNRIKYKPKDKGNRIKRTTNTLLKIDGGEEYGNSRNSVISSRRKKERYTLQKQVNGRMKKMT